MELCIVSCIMASMVFKFAFGDWFKGCRPSFRVKYSFRIATGLADLIHRSDWLVHVHTAMQTMQTGLTGPLHRSDRLSTDRALSIVFK